MAQENAMKPEKVLVVVNPVTGNSCFKPSSKPRPKTVSWTGLSQDPLLQQPSGRYEEPEEA
jgi:hypothetical protein